MSIQTITTKRLVFGVNSHVVNGTVLVDTGFNAASTDKIISEMEKQGSNPSGLELCIITHRHTDHVGGLMAIKERLGVEVAAHRLEAEAIEKATGVGVDRRLEDGDVIPLAGGIKVVHLPGHTEGNIGLLVGRNLITGDTVFENRGRLTPPPSYFSSDPGKARESILRLRDLEVESIYPSHGNPIHEGAAEIIESMIAAL